MDKPYFIECEDGIYTIIYEKQYPVDIEKESLWLVVMEIGFQSEYSYDTYHFTKEEAKAKAEKICDELNREYEEREEQMIRELNDGTWKDKV
jgi:hypothetical protein